MPWYKYTMLFELRTNLSGSSIGARIGGWSESIYYSALQREAFRDLQQARAALLPTAARIVGQRIQVVNPTGGSASSGDIYPGTWGFQSDVPQMALLCTCKSSTTPNTRRFRLAGIPDDIVLEGEYRPIGNWNQRLGNYFTQFQQWEFPGRDLSVRPTAIEQISDTGTITTGAVFSVNVGDRVRVRDAEIPGVTKVTRECVVIDVTSSSVFRVKGLPEAEMVGGTVLNVTPKNLYSIEDGTVSVNRVVMRKVGRPFGQYRGRNSRRRA